ncbi:MAG TPA: outer membrane lipoprotein carrier protein LolA [Candidatus Polarisedimenticolaceae bacterium]|nr:outer membrane lipoprotein carrier protein LolA [Candidatus Polarisedimenticolaceae bacterium]
MRGAARIVVPIAMLVFAAVHAAAPPADLPTAVRGLQAWLDGTKTFEARFRQSLLSGALGAQTTETGRLYLERPGKIRWDYLDPDRKIALLVGRSTELYLEDDRQLRRGVLSDEAGLFPKLLAGNGRLVELFEATLVPPPQEAPGDLALKLIPRGAAAAVSEVVLSLHRGDCAIAGAIVLDEMGNRTSYVFSQAKRNGKLPDGIFAFEPPPGTEIVADP